MHEFAEPILLTPQPVAGKFNTLAQLAPNPEADLKKKAKRKALTVFLCRKLIELKTDNIQAYRNMYYCNSVMQQENQELKTSYCKNRFCLVCNSIKTANLINGYLPELQKMEEPIFLTLTIKAVKAHVLSRSIDRMQRDFRAITKHLRKDRKLKIIGIRKLECNHNKYYDHYDPEHPERYQNRDFDTYNPHFHVVLDGFYEAAHFVNEWLKRYPEASKKAQDIRPADHDTFTELFKYATKIIGKNGMINPRALDNIYSAFRRRRVVQPIGIKKYVDEDAREKTVYPQLDNGTGIWTYQPEFLDWCNIDTGEFLTNFVPDKDILLLLGEYRN